MGAGRVWYRMCVGHPVPSWWLGDLDLGDAARLQVGSQEVRWMEFVHVQLGDTAQLQVGSTTGAWIGGCALRVGVLVRGQLGLYTWTSGTRRSCRWAVEN